MAAPDAEAVISRLRASGELERLRALVMNRVELDERLRQRIEDAVRGSRAFKAFSGDHCNRQLTSSLAAEVGHELSPDALNALWRVLTEAEGGVALQIDDACRAALCQLRDARPTNAGPGSKP